MESPAFHGKRVESIICLDQEPRPVTSSDWAAYVEDRLEDIDADEHTTAG